APGPGVAEPERGKQTQTGRVRAAIVRGDAHEDVFRGGLGMRDEDVEITVLAEYARIEQLEFGVLSCAAMVFRDKLCIRKFRLRVFVKKLQIRGGGSSIQIKVVFLYVFAVVAFEVRQPEETLLQKRIALVPERESEADSLMAVAEAGDAVFTPAIGAGASLVVSKIVPGVAVRAVVLANRSPLAFGKIGAPALPMDAAGA